jgi:hypothetical protein
MLLSRVRSTQPPWLHIVDASDSTILSLIDDIRGQSTFATTLRGERMTTEDGVYQEFARAFIFPRYFGHNWDALDECLADLDWIQTEGYVAFILRSERVLTEESDRELRILLGILRDAAVELSVPIEKGESWDRPARPLHTVFCTDSGHIESEHSRLSSHGAEIELLRLHRHSHSLMTDAADAAVIEGLDDWLHIVDLDVSLMSS